MSQYEQAAKNLRAALGLLADRYPEYWKRVTSGQYVHPLPMFLCPSTLRLVSVTVSNYSAVIQAEWGGKSMLLCFGLQFPARDGQILELAEEIHSAALLRVPKIQPN